jgi:hypothetical protein
MSSTVVFARELYSASILDRDTVAYFLELQEIRLAPRKLQTHLSTVDHWYTLPNLRR